MSIVKSLKKVLYIFIAILATIVGVYPLIYFLIDRRFGLLASKTAELLADPLWNICFYLHIILGGLALLIGWIQFSLSLRIRRPHLHKIIGKSYVVAVLVSAVAGIIIGTNASGGLFTALGFIMLGVVWFVTTLQAFVSIRKANVGKHQAMMIYSYSCTFAAVTLRIWLPILTSFTSEAYLIVSWLCWVPNLVIAYLIVSSIPSTVTSPG